MKKYLALFLLLSGCASCNSGVMDNYETEITLRDLIAVALIAGQAGGRYCVIRRCKDAYRVAETMLVVRNMAQIELWSDEGGDHG